MQVMTLWNKEKDRRDQELLLLLFSLKVVSDSATPWTAALQASCPPLSPKVFSISYLLSQWCHPIISSSVTPFSSGPQSFPASGSFPVSWLFASGSQSMLSVSVPGQMCLLDIKTTLIEICHKCKIYTRSWILSRDKERNTILLKLISPFSFLFLKCGCHKM